MSKTLFWIGLQIICFSAIVGCATVPQTHEQIEADRVARDSRRNVRMQPHMNRFGEVWYKGHRYLLYKGHRQMAITHAGHCTGEHAEAVGAERGHQ